MLKTTVGNVYLVAFMESFTKYSEAISIPNQTAEIFARHGVTERKIANQWRA